jgi:hypothetical protein
VKKGGCKPYQYLLPFVSVCGHPALMGHGQTRRVSSLKGKYSKFNKYGYVFQKKSLQKILSHPALNFFFLFTKPTRKRVIK